MNKREAAIVSAYTGFLAGEFSDMHAYVEEKMGMSVFTHQFGDKAFALMVRGLAKTDFVSIEIAETNLSPRELLEQRDALLDASKNLRAEQKRCNQMTPKMCDAMQAVDDAIEATE